MNRHADQGDQQHRGVRLLHAESEQPFSQRGQREADEHEQPRPQIVVLDRVRNDVQQHQTADRDQHEPVDERQHLRARLDRTGDQRARPEAGHAGEQQGMAQNDDAVRPLVSRNDRESDIVVR